MGCPYSFAAKSPAEVHPNGENAFVGIHTVRKGVRSRSAFPGRAIHLNLKILDLHAGVGERLIAQATAEGGADQVVGLGVHVVLPGRAGIVVETNFFVLAPGGACDSRNQKVTNGDPCLDEDFAAETVIHRRGSIQGVGTSVRRGAEVPELRSFHAAVAAGHFDAEDDAIIQRVPEADLAAEGCAVDFEIGIEVGTAGANLGAEIRARPGFSRRTVVVGENRAGENGGGHNGRHNGAHGIPPVRG